VAYVTSGERPGLDLIRELVERESKLHETMQQLLGETARELEPPAPPSAPPTVPLSPRELDIIQLVVNGATNQQIARQLGLSAGTVRNYNGRIFRKLRVAGRTEAAVRAIELGMVKQPLRNSRPRLDRSSDGEPQAS
jgi:DNA-binding NarL/FixJ family response regulator